MVKMIIKNLLDGKNDNEPSVFGEIHKNICNMLYVISSTDHVVDGEGMVRVSKVLMVKYSDRL